MQALTREQLQAIPAIYGTPWEGASQRYAYVPTYQVINLLEKEGFVPTRATQVGNDPTAKHMVRMRHTNDLVAKDQTRLGGVCPEVVLVNSHDGKSSFQVLAGLFRLICLNGMVVPIGMNQDNRIRHFGSAEEVVDVVYQMAAHAPKILDGARGMTAIELTKDEQGVFAAAASELRWDTETKKVNHHDLLRPRRVQDNGDDLWSVFSRVQENMIKGGVRVINGGKVRKARNIKSVQEDLRLNKGLWTLTEKMMELKAA
jgi:hypothetical protein